MAKKEWREVPVEELTEEAVRRWFCRLRELYREERHRVHNKKVEIWQLKVKITELQRELSVLKKENNRLKEWRQERKKVEWGGKLEKSDFKKKFFDSL